MAKDLEIDDKTVRRNLERIVRAAPEIEAKAVRKASKPVFKLSQKLVALDLGPLRGSGKMATAAKGNTITTFISYGNPGSAAEDYARKVHEHPSKYDPPEWKGKKIKWQQRSSRRQPGMPRSPGVFMGNVNLDKYAGISMLRGPKFLARALADHKFRFPRTVGEEIERQLKTL